MIKQENDNVQGWTHTALIPTRIQWSEHGIFQGYRLNDRGGYRIISNEYNAVVAGSDLDLSLEDVEEFAAG